MATTAGTVVTIALAVLTLGSGLHAAQARDVRLRGGLQVAQSEETGASSRPDGKAPVAGIEDTDKPAPNPSTTGAVDHEAPSPAGADPARKAVSAPSAAEAARVTKVAEPWCRSGRVSGSGAGFCLIN